MATTERQAILRVICSDPPDVPHVQVLLGNIELYSGPPLSEEEKNDACFLGPLFMFICWMQDNAMRGLGFEPMDFPISPSLLCGLVDMAKRVGEQKLKEARPMSDEEVKEKIDHGIIEAQNQFLAREEADDGK